jgi:hypothetical protein
MTAILVCVVAIAWASPHSVSFNGRSVGGSVLDEHRAAAIDHGDAVTAQGDCPPRHRSLFGGPLRHRLVHLS